MSVIRHLLPVAENISRFAERQFLVQSSCSNIANATVVYPVIRKSLPLLEIHYCCLPCFLRFLTNIF